MLSSFNAIIIFKPRT